MGLQSCVEVALIVVFGPYCKPNLTDKAFNVKLVGVMWYYERERERGLGRSREGRGERWSPRRLERREGGIVGAAVIIGFPMAPSAFVRLRFRLLIAMLHQAPHQPPALSPSLAPPPACLMTNGARIVWFPPPTHLLASPAAASDLLQQQKQPRSPGSGGGEPGKQASGCHSRRLRLLASQHPHCDCWPWGLSGWLWWWCCWRLSPSPWQRNLRGWRSCTSFRARPRRRCVAGTARTTALTGPARTRSRSRPCCATWTWAATHTRSGGCWRSSSSTCSRAAMPRNSSSEAGK